MFIHRISILLMMCIAAISGMMARERCNGDGMIGEEAFLPSYVIVVGDDFKADQLPDSLFNSVAGQVLFSVNRTGLNTRSAFVRELADRILPLANSSHWTLAGLELRGDASPEGPYWLNVQLSRARAQALINYIKPQLDAEIAAGITPITIPEDYPYLLWMLERDGDSAAPILRSIINKHTMEHPEAIKEDLKKVNGGRTWDRLLRDYFPHARAARIVLYFKPVREPKFISVDSTLVAAPKVPLIPVEGLSSTPYPRIMPLVVERPHMLSVSSNLLYDAFYMPQFGWAPMPNVALEFYPRRSQFTFKAGFMFPYYHKWDKHKFFQIRDYHLEARRYFSNDALHTGFYLGAYVNASKYGIGLSAKKGWQGEGFGGALKLGYVLPLGSGRWRVDFHVAAGCYVTRFDRYVYGNPVTGEVDGDYYYDWIQGPQSFKRRNNRLTWFGPTEIGVTFSYDLLFWRVRQKGASVLRKEVLPW